MQPERRTSSRAETNIGLATGVEMIPTTRGWADLMQFIAGFADQSVVLPSGVLLETRTPKGGRVAGYSMRFWVCPEASEV